MTPSHQQRLARRLAVWYLTKRRKREQRPMPTCTRRVRPSRNGGQDVNQTTQEVAGSRTLVSKLARLGRFLVFIGTAGWLFPHVCTENMDLTRIQNDQLAKKQ
jgi:hypothetical protein